MTFFAEQDTSVLAIVSNVIREHMPAGFMMVNLPL